MACARPSKLGEAEVDVAGLRRTELHLEQVVDRVLPPGAGDQDGHGAGDAEHGEQRAEGAPLDRAQDHPPSRTCEPAQAHALEQQRAEHRRRGRAHRLGRAHRYHAAHRVPGAGGGGGQAGGRRQQDDPPGALVVELREVEEPGVHAGHVAAQPVAQRHAGRDAGADDRRRDRQVVGDDAAVLVAQRLERCDLVALGGHLPAQHHVEDEHRHRQEDRGKEHSEGALLRDLAGQHLVGGLLAARIGAARTVGRQQPVELLDGGAGGCSGRSLMATLLKAPSMSKAAARRSRSIQNILKERSSERARVGGRVDVTRATAPRPPPAASASGR
jgi:hypothetical protein